MKTLIVLGGNRVDAHAGEEYDTIIEVKSVPTFESIPADASAIRNQLLELWEEDKGSDNRGVKVFIDAHPAYTTVVSNFSVILKGECGVNIDTSAFELTDEQLLADSDQETKELIQKLNAKGAKR